MKNTRFIIITGLSGSGKSMAQKCFEDMGYFCVDNLPTSLIPTFFELCTNTGEEYRRVAVVSDVREKSFLTEFPTILEEIQKSGYRVKLLFLETDIEMLLRRFSETRRPHPLGADKDLARAIEEEKDLLQGVKGMADIVIDTSNTNVHELRDLLNERFQSTDSDQAMAITVSSFGYKYGLPYNSDLVFDVRFLPNPYFVEGLKRKTGLDAEVECFLDEAPGTNEFLEKLCVLLDFLIPRYIREGKSYLNIAIGCTGGKHRSPAVANRVTKHLREHQYKVKATHRDIDRV
ncbi:RNase adapter RapZ [Acidobacteriota bacterium]